MGIKHACLVELGSADDYPTGFSVFHPQEKIRVYLVLGPTTSITFRVGHSSVYYKVFPLDPTPIITETIMKVGVMFAVTIECRAVDGISRIKAYTALKAAAGHCPAVTLHFYFVDQVFDALMQMSESVNLTVA
jgi:hypothetical protein